MYLQIKSGPAGRTVTRPDFPSPHFLGTTAARLVPRPAELLMLLRAALFNWLYMVVGVVGFVASCHPDPVIPCPPCYRPDHPKILLRNARPASWRPAATPLAT
jgi:hypothetical protein